VGWEVRGLQFKVLALEDYGKLTSTMKRCLILGIRFSMCAVRYFSAPSASLPDRKEGRGCPQRITHLQHQLRRQHRHLLPQAKQ